MTWRILVALDASPASLAALDAAAGLAAHLHGTLSGLFVEDVNLVRMGDHPGVCHVGFTGTSDLDLRAVASHLRMAEAQARSALRHAAERSRVPSSFRSIRGQVAGEMVAAAAEADLLVIGFSGARRTARMGRTGRAVVEGAPAPVLFIPEGASVTAPVLAVHRGSAASEAALVVAVDMAEPHEVIGLLLGPAVAVADAALRAHRPQARVRWHVLPSSASVRSTLVGQRKGLVAVGADDPLLAEGVRPLLDLLGTALLVAPARPS